MTAETMVDDDDIIDGEVLEDEPQQWPLYDAALDYLAHGWTPTPLRAKRPTQKRWVGLKPSTADCWAWWVEDHHDGIGIVCGVISGRLVVADLESELVADQSAMTSVMLAAAARGVVDLLTRAITEASCTTPSGGLHLYFTVTDTETVPGNEKLAFRGAGDKAVLLAETRGEGGQVAAPPGDARHWRGDSGPGKSVAVTRAELTSILDAFRTLDESGIKHTIPKPRKPWNPDATREPTVADAWIEPLMNHRITWADILDEGWTANRYDDEGRSLWVRPDYGDKTKAPYSAKGFESWVEGPIPVLVNHSASVVHLPTGAGQQLTPARVWARCFFGGDEAAANAALEALAVTGEIDPRIERDVPTCVLEEARRIVALREEKRAAADEWINGLPTSIPHVSVAPDVEDALFGATPILEQVRQAARSRLVSPTALLGAVLARCVAEVAVHVGLPAIIGTRASLNIYVALVGPSGAAKTTAAGVAEEFLDIAMPRARVQGTGSGEGLVASFLEPDPERKGQYILKRNPHVCILIDEIGQIAAIQSRQGSSLAPILRSGWSGSALDNINADPARRRIVPKMSYRLTAIAGVQPLAADVLFADADTGTPQRWLWLPALDPQMPDQEPEWPGSLEWAPPNPVGRKKDHHGNVTIAVPDHVRDALRAAHRARNRGQSTDMLDGHIALTRLKVAAALAALHDSYDITDQMWDIAGIIMDISRDVRTECQKAISAQVEQSMKARGRHDQARESGRREAVADAIVKDAARVCRAIDIGWGGGHDHPDDAGCTRRCITVRLPRRTPDQRDAAIAHALDVDWIAALEDLEKARYRPGTSQPAESTL